MKITTKTDGFDEVLERFKLMDRAFRKENGAKALEKAGQVMLDALKDAAPEGETGNLKASMGIISQNMTSITVGHANNLGRSKIYHWYQNFGNSFTVGTNFFSVAYLDAKDECLEIIKKTILEAMGL